MLVCDDEEINRALLERLLKGYGYHVVPVSSGVEALATLGRLQPDLVLLDVQMPGVNGFEICAQLKKAPETRLIPVALVTVLNSRDHKIRSLQAGADDFIGKPFDPEELKARVASLVRLKQYTDDLDSTEGILRSLALIIEARDQYTDGHCERLAHYAVALGATLGRPAEDLSALDRGGYLHDIGKIGIPDAVLLKPSALTPAEFELMKQHTVIGDRLCGELRSLRLVREIVRQHHERLDGSGYPDGLRGDEVSVLAQIVSTVDLYDAVTSARPYRPALPSEYAFRNFCGVHAALQRAYVEAESNEPGSKIPDDPELATMTQARAVHEVVPVDYNVPGCPPDADVIFYVLAELAQGRKPELKDELLHWH